MKNNYNKETAPQKNKVYTTEQLRDIKELLKGGASDQSIADLFGRTAGSIASVRYKLNWEVDYTLVSNVKIALSRKVKVEEMPDYLGETQSRVTYALFYLQHKELFENEGEKQTVEEKQPSPTPEPPSPQLFPQERTISDFDPRDLLRRLYDLGYRMDEKGIYVMVKQYVNLKSIISE